MFINLLEFKWKRKNGSVTYRRGLELHFVNKSVTGDRGKLKESLINKLQNYYGIAIGSIAGNLAGMKKATHASLMHCASNEVCPLHDLCPACSAC